MTGKHITVTTTQSLPAPVLTPIFHNPSTAAIVAVCDHQASGSGLPLVLVSDQVRAHALPLLHQAEGSTPLQNICTEVTLLWGLQDLTTGSFQSGLFLPVTTDLSIDLFPCHSMAFGRTLKINDGDAVYSNITPFIHNALYHFKSSFIWSPRLNDLDPPRAGNFRASAPPPQMRL